MGPADEEVLLAGDDRGDALRPLRLESGQGLGQGDGRDSSLRDCVTL